MLRALGVEPHVEAVYRALLTHPDQPMSGLAELLGLTGTELQDSLDQLADLALLRPSLDHPERLQPVSPEAGLQVLIARQQEELARQQTLVEQSRAAAALMIAEYATLRPGWGYSDVERLVGLDAVRRRIVELVASVRSEVLNLAPDGAQAPANLEASAQVDQDLFDRMVRVRTIYLESIHNDPATRGYARWMVDSGAQVRTLPSLPLRMIVFDRRLAILPIDPAESGQGAVLLQGPGVLAALCALFDQLWSSATPLTGTPGAPACGGSELTPHEHDLLRLLGQGHTDEIVARKLGVSVRTMRRTAAALMQRLNARSRFQAGARAVGRGWIDADE